MCTTLKRSLGALLLILVLPSPARADLMWFLDFLDRLSGPGPFVGHGFQFSLFCVTNQGRPLGPWDCVSLADDQVKGYRSVVKVGPNFSWARGLDNDLVYAGRPTEEQKEVNLRTYGVAGDVMPWDRLGVTVRYSRFEFCGELVQSPDRCLRRNAFGVGPIFRVRIGRRLKAVVTPIARFNIGPFTPQDFGAVGPPLGDDRVKLNVTAMLGF
jgi:hypothetical protein